jgi:hypothetical protein
MTPLTHLCIPLAIASFAAMIILSIIGSALHSKGIIRDSSPAQRISAIIFFTLFAIFSGASIPAMIYIFAAAQSKIGNADLAMVRFLRLHADGVTFAFWSVFLAGFLIALPVMWSNLSPKSPKDDQMKKEP